MFFRKRPAEANEAAGDPLLDEELDQSEGVAHGRYMIFSRTKQLHSGNWIVNARSGDGAQSLGSGFPSADWTTITS